MKLLKKWREFSEGGNGGDFFLQKGNHPIEQEAGRAGPTEGGPEQPEGGPDRPSRAGRADRPSRAGRAGRPEQEERITKAGSRNQEAPLRYIYFPLEIISIVRYCPIKISIQK